MSEMEGQLSDAINNVVVIGRNVAIAICSLVFLVAGFMALTSAGDERQMAAAKTAARNAVIGMAVIFGSTIIANALGNAVRMGS
jgi:TRAP-type C4-dicarboxylate transport system permease small subunit